jgi:hypothetical protein
MPGGQAGQLHACCQARPFAASSIIFAFITATATDDRGDPSSSRQRSSR